MEPDVRRQVSILMIVVLAILQGQCARPKSDVAARPIIEIETLELVVEIDDEGRSCSLNGEDLDCADMVETCQEAVSSGAVLGMVV